MKLSINEYNYNLPPERIAKYPLRERDCSKLLFYKRNGNVSEDIFYNIADHLPTESLLICNNTRVIHARLKFNKATGAEIEIFCLQPVDPSDYALAFQQKQKSTWLCLVGNLKRWKDEFIDKEIVTNGEKIRLHAKKIKNEGGNVIVEFSWDNNSVTFGELLSVTGNIPIPPYLDRDAEESDKTNYQTVYSKINGSVAAPTAGLHFTERVLSSLNKKNIKKEEVTLHVGAGTFQPVKNENALEHQMHSEVFFVEKETIKKISENIDRIIAVGTTSLRTLESLYWLGIKIKNQPDILPEKVAIGQWDWKYEKNDLSVKESLNTLISYLEEKKISHIESSTQIMIVPGYKFRVVKGIITNFHQPKSTLLLLIGAFIGDDWKKVYKYALENNFRFLSYGDSSLLFPCENI